MTRPDPAAYLASARSRSLTPADLVRIEIREVKATSKPDNATNNTTIRSKS